MTEDFNDFPDVDFSLAPSVGAVPREERSSAWTWIVYPDSAPPRWLDLVRGTGLVGFVSPLHDSDIKEVAEDGTVSMDKPHYHLCLIWRHATTYHNALRISAMLRCTIPKRVHSVDGLYYYSYHNQRDDKAQYAENDIIKLRGFDVTDYAVTRKSENREALDLIYSMLFSGDYPTYHDFMKAVNDSNNTVVKYCAVKYNIFIRNFYFSGGYSK